MREVVKNDGKNGPIEIDKYGAMVDALPGARYHVTTTVNRCVDRSRSRSSRSSRYHSFDRQLVSTHFSLGNDHEDSTDSTVQPLPFFYGRS